MSAGDREDILEEARGYVTKDRNSSYGEPEDNFKAIADIWAAQGVSVDGRPVNALDVSLMMLGMKLARLRHNPTHRDSWADSIGYAACGWDVAKRTLAQKPFESHAKPVAEGSALGVTDVQLIAPEKLAGDVFDRVEQVNKLGKGWLSENRCGERVTSTDYDRFGANPHAAHSYSNNTGWCDGWLSPERVAQARDIEAVKRVADRGNGQRKGHEPGS